MRIEIRPDPFEPWDEIRRYQMQIAAGKYGACAAFVGTMRDFNAGDSVAKMRLEHYPRMTERELTRLAETALHDHQLLDVLLLHRIGELRPNDPIVLVAAWSPHRHAAFTACREMMEVLKTKATFWKKEVLEEGERWVAG